MSREFSGWGVIATGGLLALLGGYWLVAGWEHVQIERGWSQFIAGAVALSGGVITISIGRLIQLLASQPPVVAPAQTSAAREAGKSPSARSAATAPETSRRIRPSAQPTFAQPVVGNVAVSSESSVPREPSPPANIEPSRGRGRFPQEDVAMSETAPVPVAEDWRATSNHTNVEEPAEVDRYSAGDSTYVMYADGSVEVRTPEGVRRYESLDALRANSGE